MLKKIITIKNVGRFRNSAATPNPQLAKYALIHGANGHGKTTICTILRSLQSGNAAHVVGRRTLGSADPPSVELLLASDQVARFVDGAWSATTDNVAIFDGTFVAENVHSGEVVDTEHMRNLLRIIIGRTGVDLAERELELAGASRTKAGEITAASRVLQSHVPAGLTLATFVALPQDADIGAKIEEQVRVVAAIREAGRVAAQAAFPEIALPALPDDFLTVLGRTLDDVSAAAEQQLAQHLAKHGMQAHGETWIAEGVGHIVDDACPFCGRDVAGVPIVATYQAMFGVTYAALKQTITALGQSILERFGDVAVSRLETHIEQNAAAAQFWSQDRSFDAASTAYPTVLVEVVRTLGRVATALVDAKLRSPLEPVVPGADLAQATAALDALQTAVTAAQAHVQTANALIAAKKTATATADLPAAERTLARLGAVEKRHGVLAGECTTYETALSEKAVIDLEKASVRGDLETHSQTVMKPYERRINGYLERFNADFRIAETTHRYPGGIATSSYQLVINNVAVDVGEGRTATDRASFKNTLSAGDRSTLALAFFLAHLDDDPGRADKIVVFDDPFQSQDAFRRRQTVHEVVRTGRDCAQVVVLSHDATFLKQVWDKAPPAERVALQISDARALGSKLLAMDLDKATQGRVASEIDDLQAFMTTGAGKPLDQIKKMRVVLETHCRTTYSAYFEADQYLGDMVGAIRIAPDEHPAKPLYDELDQINDYTKEYHHGEDVADATTDTIDPTELAGFVRRTLRIVNALQA